MSKKIKIIVISVLLVLSLALSYGAGCTLNNLNSADSTQGLDVIEEVWDIIFEDYVETEGLDAETLSQAAIRGIVEELDDPYTSYLDRNRYEDWSLGLEGKYSGIGAYVGVREDQIVVIAPIIDSPAEKAGIKAGDVILAIDGNSTAEMSLEEAVINIRGPKGTSVRLLILHEGETEPEEIEIVRDEIKVPSVHFEMKEDIAYIYIGHFSERTDKELVAVLEDLTQEAATGIILDLRNNPGGLLATVVDVASHFLEEGIVVYMLDNQGEKTTYSVEADSLTTDLPMVVLVNNYSASGSEVLAGALQDYERAIVAGNTTFGKGSVNSLYELKDGSGLLLTTARWYTPNGRLIEGDGIAPDYKLELEGEDIIQWAIDYLRSSGI